MLTASRAASTEANASLYAFRNASNSETESPVGNSIFCRLACKASLPSNLAARSCNRLRRSKNAASVSTFFTKHSGLKSSSFSNRSAQENAAFSGSTPPSRHAALASSVMKRSSPESLSAGATVFMMSSKLSRSTAAKVRSLYSGTGGSSRSSRTVLSPARSAIMPMTKGSSFLTMASPTSTS